MRKLIAAALLAAFGLIASSDDFLPWISSRSASYRDAYWTGYRDAMRGVQEATARYGFQSTFEGVRALALGATPQSLGVAGELFFWRVGPEKFYLAPLDGAISQLRGGN